MPYGKHRSYPRSSHRTRGWNHLHGTGRPGYPKTTNRPVRKAYKANRLPKSKAGQNKKAIFTLARQVKRLQVNDEGDLQHQHQRLQLFGNYTTPPDLNQMPELEAPLCFCANNFYPNGAHSPCQYYKVFVDPAGEPDFTAGSNFQKTAMLPFTTLGQQYQWNALNATQEVSRTEYMPTRARYSFVFSGQTQPFYDNLSQGAVIQPAIRFRVTFFKLRPSAVRINSGLVSNVNLPKYGGAYGRMCADQAQDRNYFSKHLHQIVADKWIVIKRPDTINDASFEITPTELVTKAFRKTLRFDIPHKHLARGKTLRPNMGPDTLPLNSTFNTMIPMSEQLWCIISSNLTDRYLTDTRCRLNLEINIARSVYWRDKHGTNTFG